MPPSQPEAAVFSDISTGDRLIISWLQYIAELLDRPERVVVVQVQCSCQTPPPPVPTKPPAPRAPILAKGDTVTMIAYPVTMPDFTASDVAKSTLHWTENGGAEQTQDFTTAGAKGTLSVADGANVDYWATETDKAGNTSDASPHGTITNASDTTPPAAPAAPTTGPGQTADAPPAPLLGRGVKKP